MKFSVYFWVEKQVISTMLSFYHENFLHIQDGQIVTPQYLQQFMIYCIKVSIGHLWVDTDHHIPREEWICIFFSLGEVEMLYHFIFYFLIYNDIRGRFYHLFRSELCSISTFFNYKDQHYLKIQIKEDIHFYQQ